VDESDHVFIVRFWQERREIEQAPPEGRGMIEHVISGERRYLKNLDEMTEFILQYVEGMDVGSAGPAGRPPWLRRLAAFFTRKPG
jgi:hypothetical protein